MPSTSRGSGSAQAQYGCNAQNLKYPGHEYFSFSFFRSENLPELPSSMNRELLQAIGVDRLVPESLAGWRPLVCDGVLFFLGNLPPQRRAEIMAAQLALPVDADPAVNRYLVSGNFLA